MLYCILVCPCSASDWNPGAIYTLVEFILCSCIYCPKCSSLWNVGLNNTSMNKWKFNLELAAIKVFMLWASGHVDKNCCSCLLYIDIADIECECEWKTLVPVYKYPLYYVTGACCKYMIMLLWGRNVITAVIFKLIPVNIIIWWFLLYYNMIYICNIKCWCKSFVRVKWMWLKYDVSFLQ